VSNSSMAGRKRAAYRVRAEGVYQVCGRSFRSYVGTRHCSGACRSKASRERKKVPSGYEKHPERPCPICGRPFRRAKHAVYCSATCKQTARLRRLAGDL
jgi:hypothetical protein